MWLANTYGSEPCPITAPENLCTIAYLCCFTNWCCIVSSSHDEVLNKLEQTITLDKGGLRNQRLSQFRRVSRTSEGWPANAAIQPHFSYNMSAEKKRPTDEDLLAQLGALGDGDEIAKETPKTAQGQPQSEADLLAELGIPERSKPTSRPHTPRVQSNSFATAPRASPKRAGFATPTSNDGTRTSEEKAPLRKSAESARSLLNITTPATETDIELDPEKQQSSAPAPAKEQSSGGGWWGGIFATASAAVKQAEALAKEIQHNEEAQRWAEQVKGNVGALRGFGMQCASSVPGSTC